jgi:O-antigen/teichoic acid export membrane protein
MVRDIARYAAARGLPGLVNFLALSLYTRLLTEREYGVYALVLAGVALAYSLALQWLSLAVLRLADPARDQRLVFLATVTRSFAPVAIATALGYGLISWLTIRDVPIAVVAAGSALLVFHAWFDLNQNLATADRDPARFGTLAAIRAVVSLVLGGTLAALGAGALGVLAGLATALLVAGTWVGFSYWRGSTRALPDPRMRAQLLQYGIPLAGAYVLDYVVSSSDRLLLGGLISTDAAGLYAPAYDLCQQSLWAVMMVVNLAAYPLAVRAVDAGDLEARDRQLRRHLALLLVLGLPAAAGLAVLAPAVSGVLGARFSHAAAELMPILAPAALLGGLKSYYFDLSFQLGRATKLQVVTVAACALLNLGLNAWWIPVWGVRGAANATLVAYAVALVLSWWLGRRVLALPVPVKPLVRVSVATVGMSLVLLPMREQTGIAAAAGLIVLGAMVYGGILLLLTGGRPRRLLDG